MELSNFNICSDMEMRHRKFIWSYFGATKNREKPTQTISNINPFFNNLCLKKGVGKCGVIIIVVNLVDLFQGAGFFLYPLNTLENQSFQEV